MGAQLGSYEYLARGGRRTIFRAHRDFQIRLQDYLKDANAADLRWEQDFIDVSFRFERHKYIGEMKVTNGYISPELAFRAALGQIVEYRFTRNWQTPPQMIIFLDQQVDAKRLALAARLKISVVLETESGVFQLANRHRGDDLCKIFPSLK